MDSYVNPTASTLRQVIQDPWIFLQVQMIQRVGHIELRHEADTHIPIDSLQELSLEDLSSWAETTTEGAFRPNKAAPTLRRGWICLVKTDDELSSALDILYPGAAADWYAEKLGTTRTTSFQEFMHRQSGMYKATRNLMDFDSDSITRAACHPRFCLRRRCWTTSGLGPETRTEKSEIPCLEPCALLLEMARRVAIKTRENQFKLDFCEGELATLESALQISLQNVSSKIREGDLRNPENPRHQQFLLHRIQSIRQNTVPQSQTSVH